MGIRGSSLCVFFVFPGGRWEGGRGRVELYRPEIQKNYIICGGG